jgi:alpha-amylase
MSGTPNGIDALVGVHEKYAGGSTNIVYCDHDLYIMERRGTDQQRGLLLVLNNSGDWNGRQVTTTWSNKELIPLAWNGRGTSAAPVNKWTDGDGVADLWAPPRGYAVYIPQ